MHAINLGLLYGMNGCSLMLGSADWCRCVGGCARLLCIGSLGRVRFVWVFGDVVATTKDGFAGYVVVWR